MVFVLCACDKKLVIDFFIDNQSNDTVFVSGTCIKHNYDNPNTNEINVKILPQEKAIFYKWETIQAFGFSRENIKHYLNSIVIYNQEKTLKYNPLDSLYRWTVTIISDDYQQTVLTIYPEDFE